MAPNVVLPARGWRLWEHVALRGPRFPAAGVLRLTPAELAVAADRFGVGEARSGADWGTFYFSSRPIDTSARTIGADPQLREWIAPRRTSFVRVSDGTPTQPGRPPQVLTPPAQEVLTLCDGTRQAATLAREASARPGREVPEVTNARTTTPAP